MNELKQLMLKNRENRVKEQGIKTEEAMEKVKTPKGGKSARHDGITAKSLKNLERNKVKHSLNTL